MEQKKVNERIAMALLRQCALVWEYCTVLPKHVVECKLTFTDVYNGTGNYKTWKKCPIGGIGMDIDERQNPSVFDRKMREVDGTEDYTSDGRWSSVKIFFQTSKSDPKQGFSCSYPVESVFSITRNFCQNNACQSLMKKAVFGVDEGGRYARLPEASVTQKAQKKPKAKVEKLQTSDVKPQASAEPTLAERLREALLKQMKKAA